MLLSLSLKKIAIGAFVVIIVMHGLDTALRAAEKTSLLNLNDALDKKNLVHVAIIGSGPAGLGAALYCGRFKRNTVVFEGQKPGGPLMDALAIKNWPGDTSIKGGELIRKLKNQAKGEGAWFVRDTVVSVNLSSWPFEIKTLNGHTIHALAVIMASGAVPRSLNIPGEKEFWGRGVTNCTKCDAPFFKDKRVMVIGGGDSAVKQATQLAPYAKEVMIMVRKNALRARPLMQAYLPQYPTIKVRYQVELRAITGDPTGVTGVRVYDHTTENETDEPIDGVFLAIGHAPNSGLVADAVNTDAHGYILTKGRTAHTSQAGVFAAGEVTDTVYHQAVVATANGVCAAIDADLFLSEHGVTSLFDQAVKQWWSGISYAHLPVLKNKNDINVYLQKATVPVCVCCVNENLPLTKELEELGEKVLQEYGDKVLFVYIDPSPEIKQEYGIQELPSLRIYHNAQLVQEVSGQISYDTVEKVLKQLVSQSDSTQ